MNPLLQIAGILALMISAGYALLWLSDHVNPGDITDEKLGLLEQPPQYVWKRWHDFIPAISLLVLAVVGVLLYI